MALTAEQWRDRLDAALTERLPRLKLYSDYYRGDHRLQFATSKFREAFGEMFEAFATNWCGLVVDVAVERLEIQGFRFGEDDADGDAWAMWQANRLDAQSIAGHTEAVKCETAYIQTGPPRRPGGQPVITIEAPTQVITESDPSDRQHVLAALKKYVDQSGDVVSVVYLEDEIVTYRRSGVVERLRGLGLDIPISATGSEEVGRRPNLLGRVPIVPLENSPSLLGGGVSDLKPAIALNDAANKFFTDMIHASEFTSFPQRVATGVQLPRDPITGEVLPEAEIRAAVSRLWAFEAPDASVTQLAAGDLSSYVEGVDLAVQHLAAQTRTPPQLLLTKLANVSADALTAAESGLVARCKRKHVDFSDSWEQAMRDAFRWRAIDRQESGEDAGEDLRRAEMFEAETIWADPQTQDPIVLSQSLTNKQSIGVPQVVLWEEADYSQQQIQRMQRLKKVEEEKAERLAKEQAAQGEAVDAAANANPRTYAGGKPIIVESTSDGVTVTGLPAPEVDDA